MNQDSENQSSSSQFLKTDGGKTKSNAIEIPSISLPKGGGAIKGIDEKFSVNAVNGTSSFSIPLPFSPARGASPSLSLSYNSGAGNGIFGLGWDLNLGSIKRKTDKGLPQYIDSIDSDTFLFPEAEDLVPEFKKEKKDDESLEFLLDENGDYIINEKDSPDGLFIIRFYKPRIEGLFARLERWTEKLTGIIKWRVITKENVTTLFGWTNNSIISNPNDPIKIYEWLPEFVFDDKGNCSQYIYKKEDKVGFKESFLHNHNRIRDGKITYTNLYLDKVLYGNKFPHKQFGDEFPPEADYIFQTVFDYGTLKKDDGGFDKLNKWDFRPDAFSDYKAGFEIRTTRLCKRVLLFHVFEELALKVDKSDKKTLIKSINFEYDTSTEQDFTFLKSITSFGYIKKKDGSYSHKKLPPMEFEYQKHDWNCEIKTISTKALIHSPVGLDEQQYQFTDLFNEGLSGILTEQANGWYYKHNLGDGEFEQAKLVTPKPSFVGLGRQLQLADLDADGGKQLVNYGSEPKGYFELDDDNEWQGLQTFKALPNIDFGDANTRMLDLNGDGLPEVVISEDSVFTWYASEGRDGFAAGQKTVKPFDEEAGPHIVFADQKQTIYLADMSGDGMTDILRIRNGEICYWPNLGYGKFGAKVAMDDAPVFDHPDSFNPAYLRLADIDGSGTSDIIYLGKNKFSCWLNLSGNRFSEKPFEIESFPEVHSQSKITVTDLLGNGVACIVWSSPLAKDANAPLKYIDLMNSKKPHIMVKYLNNMGKEVSLEYTPSTHFYLEDKRLGKPWVTKLHFPVHCVSKTTIEDKISGHKFVSKYKYHHGYFDHPEREFRGFGMVEQIDAETFEHWEKSEATNITDAKLHQEPVVSKTWNHTGAFLREEKILDQFAEDYWYKEMQRKGFIVDHSEVALPDARIVTAPGMDPAILDNLSAQEWQEALRACKGMGLRSEVFAYDAIKFGNTEDARIKELTPFTVATHNCVIELLQPRGKNKHAIFVVKESEAITYNYERKPEDPHIAHNLNIKLDEYGNVLESAAVVYPRISTDSSLPQETQDAQGLKPLITYKHNQFTNDIITDDTITVDAYRLRVPSEVKTFELKGVKKKDEANSSYSIADFDDILNKSEEVSYHEIDKEPDDSVPPEDYKPLKRLIEHVRSTYYNNNLKDELALHKLNSLAIPFQSYQLAYTPELISDIFEGNSAASAKVNDALMQDEGKFTHWKDENDIEDLNWWIRSGTTQLLEGADTVSIAQNRFYMPISYTDPYGSITKVKYYTPYFLFINETEDALGNKSGVESFNFRTLSPQKMKDINGNFSEVITDELGLVKAMAIMSKGDEADNLEDFKEITDDDETTLIRNYFEANNSVQLTHFGKSLLNQATTRFLYDLDIYKKMVDENTQHIANGEPEKIITPRPAVVSSIIREKHYQQLADSPVQIAFEYTNGIGEVVMKKVQAEPGEAKQVTVNPDNTISVIPINTADLVPKQLRWIGNGRTIKNNKGSAVKQYEPYFSVSWNYEDYKELVESGVTPIMYYDATGRSIKTEMPDGTFSKIEFNSWKQTVYDQNDTVKDSDWYKKRTEITSADYIDDPKEQIAANKAAEHYDTPTQLHFDTLGRPVLQIENNSTNPDRDNKLSKTKIVLDIEGNLRKVIDAREIPENAYKGNTVMQYKYDMLGNIVYQKSMDAGQRWFLTNVLGNLIRTWDERNHEFQFKYDDLHRPIESKIIGGDRLDQNNDPLPLNNIYDKIIYGEGISLIGKTDKELNLRGQVYRHFDTGGVVETPEYDFKGQPMSTSRKLFKDYKNVVNWTNMNIAPAALTKVLEPDTFSFTTETDALGRITKQTAPDKSVITPTYNEAGLLNGEMVNHFNLKTNTYQGDTEYIENINYNEKGQRNYIKYGNGVKTTFKYDEKTFRLINLVSNKNNKALQDIFYTYDPIGNILRIEDKANDTSFFKNMHIEPVSEYIYDALYRLKEAKGRENGSALNFANNDNWNDSPKMISNHIPGDPMAVESYTEKYIYDEVGNIKEMKHLHKWTRTYEYEIDSNRLKNTICPEGNDPFKYSHQPQHGFITKLPHLSKMGWNFKEELVSTSQQVVNPENGTPETTYYQYDGQGQRIRKITETQAAAGGDPTKKDERIYFAGYETYRTYDANEIYFERESLSLMDEEHRFVIIETVKKNNKANPEPSEIKGARLRRYQLHNHLGSASLEFDNNAIVINYEEYHPYGTTAYQANNAEIKAAAKRYRFSGKERDEESGLYYYGARYYAAWLGRWCSCDPAGTNGGINLYEFVKNNPITNYDPDGKKPKGSWGKFKAFLFDAEYFNEVRRSAGVKSGQELLEDRLASGETKFTDPSFNASEVSAGVAAAGKGAILPAKIIAWAAPVVLTGGLAAEAGFGLHTLTSAGATLKGVGLNASIKTVMAMEAEMGYAVSALEMGIGVKGTGLTLGFLEAFATAHGLSQGLPMEVVNPQSLLPKSSSNISTDLGSSIVQAGSDDVVRSGAVALANKTGNRLTGLSHRFLSNVDEVNILAHGIGRTQTSIGAYGIQIGNATFSPAELARSMVQTGWKGGTIRLIACRTGVGEVGGIAFGEALANELQALGRSSVVIAPKGNVNILEGFHGLPQVRSKQGQLLPLNKGWKYFTGQ